MRSEPAGRTNAVENHVDTLVDEAYLDVCARAWQTTSGHAQSVLARLDLGAVDPLDQHRSHCVTWLRRAAGYQMPGRPASASAAAREPAPTTDLLRHVADAYLRFLGGTASGRSILLAGEGLRLWSEYFQSRNSLYRPLNAVAAAAVNNVLRTGDGTRILEVGAGTGGATAHLLTAWPDDLRDAYDYTVTDMSAGLLVGTRRTLGGQAPPHVRLDFRRFDFDRPGGQGLAPGSFDVVLAVNALHNAADVPATLRNLRSLLRPGGHLVFSESLCATGDLVHQDFIFNLLPMRPDACARASRFSAQAAWREHVAAAGIDADIQVNTRGPELVMMAVTAGEAKP